MTTTDGLEEALTRAGLSVGPEDVARLAEGREFVRALVHAMGSAPSSAVLDPDGLWWLSAGSPGRVGHRDDEMTSE